MRIRKRHRYLINQGSDGQTISRELAAIHKFAPSTSAKAYAQAETMIMNGYMTFSEDEIDGYAPD